MVNITNHYGNANQNHNEVLLPHRMAIIKENTKNKWRKVTGAASMENSIEVSQKTKNRITT